MSHHYPARGGAAAYSRGHDRHKHEPEETKVVRGGQVVETQTDERLENPNHREAIPEQDAVPTEAQARQLEKDRREQKTRSNEKHHKPPAHTHGKQAHQASSVQQSAGPAKTLPEAAAIVERRVAPYHLGSRPNIEAGVRKGDVILGSLKIIKWTTGIAFVRCPGLGVDVEIHGTDARGDAFADDIVAVELSSQDTWSDIATTDAADAVADAVSPARLAPVFNAKLRDPTAPAATLADGREIKHVIDDSSVAEGRAHADPVTSIYNALGVKPPTVPAGRKPRGVVVAVMERRFKLLHPSRIVEGQLAAKSASLQGGRYYKFRSYDVKYPFIAVYGRDVPSSLHEGISDMLPLVEIMPSSDGSPDWIDKRFPRGRILSSLGQSGTTEAESRAIAAANEVKDTEFTDEVLDCVFQDFKVPPAEKIREMGRRDLRDEEFVCTIDPATARDLDDAISITKTPGGFRVGVHIADVSFFVPINSALDLEARDRCTSTYFVERVIPMLPHKLCEDYCSLNAGEDKFAFSCIFQLDNNCNITSEWFGQTVIRNRCRMAYEDAQRIIEGDLSGDSLVIHEEELKTEGVTREQLVKDVVKSTQMMFHVASKLRERHFERGALSLNKGKLKFQFEDINQRVAPKGFGLEVTKEANWMIEQFMLLANIRVAEKIIEFLPESALLRKHDFPDRRKMKAFTDAARKHGYNISAKSSKGLSDSLQQYANDPNSDTLRLMATYTMMLAKYVCSGDEGGLGDEPQDMGHYALATSAYTHFTSPIRRYADLVVHRQLLVALDIEQQYKLKKISKDEDPEGMRVRIEDTPHSGLYLPPFTIIEIAEKCNTRKENARKCSDQSLKLFFCLYLEAIRLKAESDPSIDPVQRTDTQVVRMKDDRFSVFSPEIAADCEIFMNSKNQLWRGECVYDKASKSFAINWGVAPGESEGAVDTIETVELFFKVPVELRVVRENGLLKLDMVLLPPWYRNRTVGVLRTL